MEVLIVLIMCLALSQGLSLSDRRDGRIVGGAKIPIGKAPFQAALFGNGEFFCGGETNI